MKKNRYSILLISILGILQAGIAGEHPPPVLLNGQSPLKPYYMWEEIQADQIQFPFINPMFERQLSFEAPGEFYQRWHSTRSIPLHFRLSSDSKIDDGNGGLRQVIYGTALLRMTDHVTMQNDFEVDSDGSLDDHYRGKKTEAFGEWTGYLQQSSISYTYDGGHLVGGRGNVFSSIMNSSIMINPDFPPAEHLWWHHDIKKLSFDWVVKSLATVNGANRFLTLHRYAIEQPCWRLGFSEMVMVSYTTIGAPQFRYLTPASFFYETEVNGGNNANIAWNFDFMAKFKDYTFMGEFLVDDYALDGDTPPKLGFKLGMGHTGNYGNIYTEYVRINRWTGNAFDLELRFVEDDVLIGSPLGSDAHSIKIQAFRQFSEQLYSNVTLRWIEAGSGDIHEWPDGIGDSADFGYGSEPFPSRPISSLYEANLTIDYFVNARVNTAISIDMSSIRSTSMQFHLRLAL
jgi:hypothetical protein